MFFVLYQDSVTTEMANRRRGDVNSLPKGRETTKIFDLTQQTETLGVNLEDHQGRSLIPIDSTFHHLIDTDFPGLIEEVTYPYEWFRKNQGKKPPISRTEGTLQELYCETRYLLQNGMWSDLIISGFMLEFLWIYPAGFEAILTKTWISFNVTIGKAGEIINPIDLVDLQYVKTTFGHTQSRDVSEADARSLFLALCSIYRRAQARTGTDEYFNKINISLRGYFSQHLSEVRSIDLDLVQAHILHERLTVNYRKVIAALDMFLAYVPDVPGSAIRRATLSSRYIGCSALSSTVQVASHFDMPPSSLQGMITSSSLMRDVARLTRIGQEMGNEHGYFPYQAELGLIQKSAYSSTANPSYYLWIQTIGSIGGLDRSRNARYPDRVSGTHQIMLSGVSISLRLARLRQRLSEQEKEGLEAEASDEMRLDKYEAITEAVVHELQTYKGLNENHIKLSKSIVAAFPTPRKGSIGQKVQAFVNSLNYIDPMSIDE